MLVLTRKRGQRVHLAKNGAEGEAPLLITVTVLDLQSGRIRLGFEAPGDWIIVREEVLDSPPTQEGGGPCARAS